MGSITISQSYGSVQIDNSSFEGNTSNSSSSANGGAILVNTSSSDDVVFSGVLFDSNIAHSSGGAIYINGAQDVEISTSRFLNNESFISCLLYSIWWCCPDIQCGDDFFEQQHLVWGCTATKFSTLSAYGGAFYAGNVERWNITNVIFQDNESEANGGALAVDSIDDVSLVNNTFVGNSSTQGDDLWATLSPTEIINTIFAQSSGSAAVYAADGTSASANVAYSDWFGNTSNTSGSFGFSVTSNSNIVNDPVFTLYSQDGNCENDVLTLEPTSTLIDTGDPTRFDLDGTRSDIETFGGTTLLDADLDGFGALVDCDDNDASAYPGAAFFWNLLLLVCSMVMAMAMGIVHRRVLWYKQGKTAMMLIFNKTWWCRVVRWHR